MYFEEEEVRRSRDARRRAAHIKIEITFIHSKINIIIDNTW